MSDRAMIDLPTELTLPQALSRQARENPAEIALRQKEHGIWKPLTWADYHRRAVRVGLGLRAAGLSEGGHVGMLSENRAEWVLSQLGAGLVGAVTVGVYPTSPTVEVAYVLEHGDAEIVVCEDQEQSDKVIEARDRLPRLRKIVVMEKKGLADTRSRAPELVIGFDELEALGAAAEAEGAARIEAVLQRQTHADTALIIYTSGSTGKPKGAMISYGNVAAMAAGVVDRLGLLPSTSHLSYLPLCHVAEQMLTVFVPLYLGSRVDFGESIRTVQEDLREVAPTMFLGVPRIWEKLHAAISIRIQESGRWRRALYARAVAACSPFAYRTASERSLRERLVFGLAYLLVFRALQNYIGLRFGSNSSGNRFTENVFTRNLHPVETGGSDVSENRWAVNGVGNYWDSDLETDLDRNGINDLPHRELDSLGILRRDFPVVAFLSESPALKLLRFANERAVVPGLSAIEDPSPLTTRFWKIRAQRSNPLFRNK